MISDDREPRTLLLRGEAGEVLGGPLDTAEFQTRGFHERAGYRLFGELADDPPGSRIFDGEESLALPELG